MNRDSTTRNVRLALLAVLLATPTSTAHALEALDGRIQAHGFFESQMRVISDDFSGDYDLAQWHQVLNIELEVDILPDGWGYIDLLSAYVRIEGRYDCVYSHGCGMIQGADTYGDKAKNLPARIANAHESTYHGSILLDQIETRKIRFEDLDGDGVEDTTTVEVEITRHGDRIADNRQPLLLEDAPGFSGLSALAGADGYTGTAPFGNAQNGGTIAPQPNKTVHRAEFNGMIIPEILPVSQGGTGDPGGDWALFDDDPFEFVFTRFLDFKFAHRGLRGGGGGGMPTAVMGPWLPKNFIYPNATMADIDNPFDATVTPELLRRSAFNGTFYATTRYGTDYSIGDIDSDAPDPATFFENHIQDVTARDNFNDGVSFGNVLRGTSIAQLDTSIVFTPIFFSPNLGSLTVVNLPEGLIYRANPNSPQGPPRSGAAPVPGIAASTSRVRRGTAKPMRSIPIHDAGRFAEEDTIARGVYLPSRGLRETIASGRLDPHPLNIDETDRAWNRGASQQDEGELKEAYIDLETWDSRLWLRLGKQNIVWGKTELFRTTDQFNPVDLALVTLGNLEETRIALWSARAVLSLYEVGPFDDVRLEFAANIDDFESSDFGACGEPFAPNPVCSAAFGVFAHGLFGIGLAGVDFPDSPWEDLSKIEFGGRIEWRWDRFSFAIADFYGYEDLPYIDRISTYSRNVDPNTGRMRAMGATGPCTTQPLALRERDTGPLTIDGDCLQAGPTRRDNRDIEIVGGIAMNTFLADPTDPAFNDPTIIEFDPINAPGALADPNDRTKPTYSPNNSLDAHPVNQQFFTAICAGTVGVSGLDPAACVGTIFGSQQGLPIDRNLFRLSNVVGNALTGSGFGDGTSPLSFSMGLITTGIDRFDALEYDAAVVKLNRDIGDGEPGGLGQFGEYTFQQRVNGEIDYGGNNYGCTDNSLVSASPRGVTIFGIFVGTFNVDNPVPCHSSGSAEDGLGLYLSAEQQALLGCGPFFGTNCSDSGIDLLNAEASVLFQSFPGFEGTGIAGPGSPNFRGGRAGPTPRQWTMTNTKYDPRTNLSAGRRLQDDGQDRMQPGTLFFQGGPVGTVVVNTDTGEQQVLPGARRAVLWDPATNVLSVNPDYVPAQDGCIGTRALYNRLGLAGQLDPACDLSGSPNVRLHPLRHPLSTVGTDEPQFFASEMAAVSHNFLVLITILDSQFEDRRPFAICKPNPAARDFCLLDANGEPQPVCSLATPQNCGNVRGLLGLSGVTRNTMRAGGNGTFGRRTFTWQSGGEAVLAFARRNVLGFSGDFAEDVTKSNWSLEATWIEGVPRGHRDSYSGVEIADDYNITVSVDRPTFVNFLNANRTFFFNSQWFFRYRDYRESTGRWDLLGTFSILAGYFQDRLLPNVTFVWDVRTTTFAVLPQVQYRYTEAFSIVVGAQFFAGGPQINPISVNGLGPVSNEQGQYAYSQAEDGGVAIVRHLDNFFIRLRYSF